MGLGKMYNLDDTILFGKYKDETILDIIETDIQYITYLIENHEFELDSEAYNYYQGKLENN